MGNLKDKDLRTRLIDTSLTVKFRKAVAPHEGDKEMQHVVADRFLIDLFRRWGLTDLAKEFDDLSKWYT